MAYEFLKNRDIILFALKPWDIEIGSSSKKYARVFAKNNNRVLFVNRALDRVSTVKFRNDPKIRLRMESLRDKEKSLQQVENGIWTLNPSTVLESINKIPFPGVFDWLNRINNRRLANQINYAADKLNFKDIILYIENDFIRAFYLNEMIHNLSTTVYYIRDYLPSQGYFKTHGKRLEPALIRKEDVVITNSVYLMNYARKHNPGSHFVGQGCDLELFSGESHKMPADLAGISHPIIGYTGALLTTRLDIGLIRQLAKSRPDYNFVFVGPEDEEFEKSDLHQLPNIFFLGRKRPEELPGYIFYFDVCINPQKINEMTVGNYPLKIDEYLAMGKPIVATKTEAMEMFSDFAELCADTGEYLLGIDKMLSEGQTIELVNKRKGFAASHTRENCVGQLDNILINTNN